MRILNVMLSRDLGGIQQAFLDYNKALKLEGIEVINVTSFFAKINAYIEKTFKLFNFGPWDIFSRLYLKLIIIFSKPNIIIAHGNRAISFATGVHIPVIGVAHNYTLKHLRRCDYIIALTEHMRKYLIEHNFNTNRIFVVPNMINLEENNTFKDYRKPIMIGTIARFVPKKGIDTFINSLARLKQDGYVFKALVGGEGVEKSNLLNLSNQLGLTNDIEFLGWVENKKEFFQSIDIFVLSSLHEPFGIIILEAMANGTPVIATNTEGPAEIIREPLDGLLCKINSSEDLAKKISYLIDNPLLAKRYVKSGYLRLKENYDMKVVAKSLSSYIKSIIR